MPATTIAGARTYVQVMEGAVDRAAEPARAGAAPALAPRWQRRVLVAAGAYNLVWGTWVILRPGDLFRLTGAPQPAYPELWQCIGMFVLVWGIGYLVAATDPWRHWPVVLVGMVGKLLGPIGFLVAVYRDVFPTSWGWTIVTNDLVWWVPFALILAGAWRANAGPDLRERLRRARRATGTDGATCDMDVPERPSPAGLEGRERLLERTRDGRPLLVVFLRHSGCVFCRAALQHLAREQHRLSPEDVGLVVVHLDEDPVRMQALLAHHGLDDVEVIHDPERELYRAFDLRSLPTRAHFGWRQWMAGVRSFLGEGVFVGAPRGDALQLPGAVVLSAGEVIAAQRPRHSGEQVDLDALVAASTWAASVRSIA